MTGQRLLLHMSQSGRSAQERLPLPKWHRRLMSPSVIGSLKTSASKLPARLEFCMEAQSPMPTLQSWLLKETSTGSLSEELLSKMPSGPSSAQPTLMPLSEQQTNYVRVMHLLMLQKHGFSDAFKFNLRKTRKWQWKAFLAVSCYGSTLKNRSVHLKNKHK